MNINTHQAECVCGVVKHTHTSTSHQVSQHKVRKHEDVRPQSQECAKLKDQKMK